MDWWIYLLLALSAASLIIGLIALSKAGQQPKSDGSLSACSAICSRSCAFRAKKPRKLYKALSKNLSELLAASQAQSSALQDKRLAELNLQITQRNDTLQRTMDNGLKLMDDRGGPAHIAHRTAAGANAADHGAAYPYHAGG